MSYIYIYIYMYIIEYWIIVDTVIYQLSSVGCIFRITLKNLDGKQQWHVLKYGSCYVNVLRARIILHLNIDISALSFAPSQMFVMIIKHAINLRVHKTFCKYLGWMLFKI